MTKLQCSQSVFPNRVALLKDMDCFGFLDHVSREAHQYHLVCSHTVLEYVLSNCVVLGLNGD